MHIGFDLDGTLNHWGPTGWDLYLEPYGEAAQNIPRHKDQRSFNLKLSRTPEECAIIDEVFNAPNFYRDLEPIEGAIEAVKLTVERGHTVSIVTSPWWSNPNCLQDKSDWVARHLGEEYRPLIFFGSDKTMWRGDYLIDDKPAIHGLYEDNKAWTQILFDQPYNREVRGLERLKSWEDWSEMLLNLEFEKLVTARDAAELRAAKEADDGKRVTLAELQAE